MPAGAIAEVAWPVVTGLVVIAIVVLGIRNIRKRGRAESDRDHALEREGRNAEADEIMAEPDVDLATYSDRLRDELSED